MSELFILFESAAGYVLFHVEEWDQIAQETQATQEAILDLHRFRKVVTFRAFYPFSNAQEALENIEAIAKGSATEVLCHFLEQNLPMASSKKKKQKYLLGVCEPSIGKALAERGFPAYYHQNIHELVRGCRMHIQGLVKQLADIDMDKFQVGLGHSYSRTKIQFDPNRQDKPIMQCIALIDSLDKVVNTFSMRLREWYCWHFPELGKILPDNSTFCKVVQIIRDRDSFDESENKELLLEACSNNDLLAEEILNSMKHSMGQEMSEFDMENIELFANQVQKLGDQRKTLGTYLDNKLNVVAPNLKTLVGDTLAARLINRAGSLVNLAKYPASTIQILGAEKALFRALKTRGKTPKYGLLFQSTFIGRAAQKNKGKISRYLANKCSLAARIDNFNVIQTSIFGEKMRDQVEARLKYFAEGIIPKKNLDVMKDALIEYQSVLTLTFSKSLKKRKKQDKSKLKNEIVDASSDVAAIQDTNDDAQADDNQSIEKPKKKKKKAKTEK